jgi:hypothetical protein
MASDVVLVLRSEHRRLLQLLERSQRSSRGLSDPMAELRRELSAHVAAAGSEIASLMPRCEGSVGQEWAADLDHVADLAVGDDLVALQAGTRSLVQTEETVLVPWLEEALSVDERRRVGKLYRVRREMHSRSRVSRRQRSRTELYEMARRAGVENRSRMTQAELQSAVDAWERAREPSRGGTASAAG